MIRRHRPTKKTPLFNGLSLIEKTALIGCPIGITLIDYILIQSIFGYSSLVSLIISVVSTITLIGLITLLINFLIGD